MFFGDARRKAIEQMMEAANRHDEVRDVLRRALKRLFIERGRAEKEVLEPAEEYVNKLSNSPKEFEATVSELSTEVVPYRERDDFSGTESDWHSIFGAAAAAGGTLGVLTALFGPGIAMWIATTFGTASTGVAISSLSGAAATSAATAWLGGGAVAAGGGGIALGARLLGIFGPIGWTIAGVSLVAIPVVTKTIINRKQAKAATNVRIQIETEIAWMTAANVEVEGLERLTRENIENCLTELRLLKRHAPENYEDFDDEQKARLAALINGLQALIELLRRRLDL